VTFTTITSNKQNSVAAASLMHVTQPYDQVNAASAVQVMLHPGRAPVSIEDLRAHSSAF
jgi:hypothetical protein